MMNGMDSVQPSYGKTAVVAGKSAGESASPKAAEETKAAEQDVYQPTQKPAVGDAGVSYKPNGKLVEQLKAEQEEIKGRFISMVSDMLRKQGKYVNTASDDIWKTIASGDYKVDAATQSAAKDAISEDGYWGVKQTSERFVNFAKALVGGDPSRVGEMRDAFLKGYAQAEKAWGGALPGLAQETKQATLDLFDQWEKEGQTVGQETA